MVGFPAVRQVSEKGWFGKRYIRTGPLFISVGNWLFQEGGALGYGFPDNPTLLGKLLGGTEETGDVIQGEDFIILAEKYAGKFRQGDRTFLHLYAFDQLRVVGIYPLSIPQDKRMNEKWGDQMATTAMNLAFVYGLALGFWQRDAFEECWDETYRSIPEEEWEDAKHTGLVFSEKQQERPLHEAVKELANMAIEWGTEANALIEDDIEILKRIALSE